MKKPAQPVKKLSVRRRQLRELDAPTLKGAQGGYYPEITEITSPSLGFGTGRGNHNQRLAA